MSIGSLLPRHARYRPDHLAIVFEDQRLTFSDFNRRVNRLANAFMDAFPRTAAGKTLKRVMREPYWTHEDSQI
jgi:acyl-CoA synthetase (AMP-forming)/AMP-acid ligase II